MSAITEGPWVGDERRGFDDVHDPAESGPLAIDVLRGRENLGADAVDSFLREHTSPIVEGDRATFLFRGEADEVKVHHRVVGLPPAIAMGRLHGTDLWAATIQLPPRSRVEYHYEVVRHGEHHRFDDPLNPLVARNPMGTASIARATGYVEPDWVRFDPEARHGSLDELTVSSAALGRPTTVRLYRPARFRSTHRYPLLVVHDGDDYLEYAAMRTVLDNLIHRLEVAEVVVAFTSSHDRLVEYANDERHHRFLADELVPTLEDRLPLIGAPRGRCLVGASFGGIASFSAALAHPGVFGSLLLQSTSFLVRDFDDEEVPPVFDPIVELLRRYRRRPVRVADRIHQSVGAYEPMVAGNRAMAPVLGASGARLRYIESRDGHNWENWRDRLRDALSWLFPGPQLYVYE